MVFLVPCVVSPSPAPGRETYTSARACWVCRDLQSTGYDSPPPPAVSSKEVARSISNKQPQVFLVFQLYVMEMFVGHCWHEQINLNDISFLDRVAQGHT